MVRNVKRRSSSRCTFAALLAAVLFAYPFRANAADDTQIILRAVEGKLVGAAPITLYAGSDGVIDYAPHPYEISAPEGMGLFQTARLKSPVDEQHIDSLLRELTEITEAIVSNGFYPAQIDEPFRQRMKRNQYQIIPSDRDQIWTKILEKTVGKHLNYEELEDLKASYRELLAYSGTTSELLASQHALSLTLTLVREALEETASVEPAFSIGLVSEYELLPQIRRHLRDSLRKALGVDDIKIRARPSANFPANSLFLIYNGMETIELEPELNAFHNILITSPYGSAFPARQCYELVRYWSLVEENSLYTVGDRLFISRLVNPLGKVNDLPAADNADISSRIEKGCNELSKLGEIEELKREAANQIATRFLWSSLPEYWKKADVVEQIKSYIAADVPSNFKEKIADVAFNFFFNERGERRNDVLRKQLLAWIGGAQTSSDVISYEEDAPPFFQSDPALYYENVWFSPPSNNRFSVHFRELDLRLRSALLQNATGAETGSEQAAAGDRGTALRLSFGVEKAALVRQLADRYTQVRKELEAAIANYNGGDIYPPSPMLVLAAHVKRGDQVKQGDSLARLRPLNSAVLLLERPSDEIVQYLPVGSRLTIALRDGDFPLGIPAREKLLLRDDREKLFQRLKDLYQKCLPHQFNATVLETSKDTVKIGLDVTVQQMTFISAPFGCVAFLQSERLLLGSLEIPSDWHGRFWLPSGLSGWDETVTVDITPDVNWRREGQTNTNWAKFREQFK